MEAIISQIPIIPVGAFFIAAALFGYQLYVYIRYKKKQRAPTIPDFPVPGNTPSPESLITTVAVTEQGQQKKVKSSKKQSYGLYYAVVSMALIGVGIIAFSLFSQQKLVYIPRAAQDTTPSTGPATPTVTSAPTPTPLSVIQTTISPSAVLPSPTSAASFVPTKIPSLTLTPSPTPSPTPAPTVQPTVTPTNQQSRDIPPTQSLIALAATSTPSTKPSVVPTNIQQHTTPQVKPTTQQSIQSIPSTGLLLWPIALILIGGGLLVLGLVF